MTTSNAFIWSTPGSLPLARRGASYRSNGADSLVRGRSSVVAVHGVRVVVVPVAAVGVQLARHDAGVTVDLQVDVPAEAVVGQRQRRDGVEGVRDGQGAKTKHFGSPSRWWRRLFADASTI